MKIYLLNLSVRHIYLFIFIFIGVIIAYVAYTMKVLGLEPCSLCIAQQFLYCLIGIAAFLAFLCNPRVKICICYALFILFIALLGIWVSARQVWLQSLPEDKIPICGLPIEYIVEVLPFKELLLALFVGDGNCAQVQWSLLNLSMAGWSLILFIFLLLLSLFIILKVNSIYK